MSCWFYWRTSNLYPFWAKLPYGYIHLRRPPWHVSGSEGLRNNTLSQGTPSSPSPRVFPLHCRKAYFLLAVLPIKNKWNCLSGAQLNSNRSTTTMRTTTERNLDRKSPTCHGLVCFVEGGLSTLFPFILPLKLQGIPFPFPCVASYSPE